MSKILILTASPRRDKVIDDQLSDELKKKGHEVWVRPCLREGRPAILDLKPDIVVVPPIRNPYARDFAETLKGWGCGVVTRHTEASCDWQDFKKMEPHKQNGEILGAFRYIVDAEIVWGKDEAEILSRRGGPFPIVPVGSLAVDIYQRPKYRERFLSRPNFNKKLGLSKKQTILIASPWGFTDSAPDLQIDEMREFVNDNEGRDRHIAMIKKVAKGLPDWNVVVTTHPGVDVEYYKKELPDIVIDCETIATELIVNSDALIHAGSTMAMEAHFAGIPAFQYGDVNRAYSDNWFQCNSPLSKVSPSFKSVPALLRAIKKIKGDNADKEQLKILEAGRYGLIDGKATERAANVIGNVSGKFNYNWPKAHRDYDQLHMFKDAEKILNKSFCNVCKAPLFIVKPEWFEQICTAVNGGDDLRERIKKIRSHTACPGCGARMFIK